MKINGYQIDDQIISRVCARIRAQAADTGVTAMGVAGWFTEEGVPWAHRHSFPATMTACEAANRTLQILRKANVIKFVKGKGACWRIV